jgi:hypothetical protein
MDHSTTPVPSPVDAAVTVPGLPVPAMPPGECVEWNGYMEHGYGKVFVGGKMRLVHRLVWEKTHGPIPDGLVLDHLCRNTACVNTDHMEVVTRAVNVMRGLGPCARNARKTTCPKGHLLEGENLCKGEGRRRKCRTCRNARQKAAGPATRARAKARKNNA